MTEEILSKRILHRTLITKELFKQFLEEFNIEATISSSLLEKSMHYYFHDTQIMKNNHLAVNRTNDGKKFAFMVKAINITKPIMLKCNASVFREIYVNELFSLYCGVSHIKDQNIKNVVLDNMKNFVYLIFNQEMNYLQLALTMDLLFKKESS